MNASAYRLSWFAIATIVALRVGVGMHFFGEGAKKLESGKPFSQYFLSSAKGPLAPYFHDMVWDKDGKARLGFSQTDGELPVVDLAPTKEAWDLFRSRIVDHYNLATDDELAAAETAVDRRVEELEWYIGDNEEDILEYFSGLDRVRENQSDQARQEVASLWGQTQSIEADMAKKRGAWLATINKTWWGLEADLNKVGAASNADAEYLKIEMPGRKPLDSMAIDKIIPWFDITVGTLLIVGLFTRVAAFSAGLFLLSVCVSQWPTALGAQPIWYQAIEMLACFALVGIAAGRFAGLDSILHNIRLWCCPPKEPSYE